MADSYRRPVGPGCGVADVRARTTAAGWYTYAPNTDSRYTGDQVNSSKGETLDAFTARADDLWRAAGWILVDEVTP